MRRRVMGWKSAWNVLPTALAVGLHIEGGIREQNAIRRRDQSRDWITFLLVAFGQKFCILVGGIQCGRIKRDYIAHDVIFIHIVIPKTCPGRGVAEVKIVIKSA